MTKSKISKINREWGTYLDAPHYYDAFKMEEYDAAADDQVRTLRDIDDVYRAIVDKNDPPNGLTKRQAEELIESVVSTGAVEIDEATHDDLVAYLMLD